MVLGKLLKVCDEELRKVGRAIVAVWDLIVEADQRALHALFILLGLR